MPKKRSKQGTMTLAHLRGLILLFPEDTLGSLVRLSPEPMYSGRYGVLIGISDPKASRPYITVCFKAHTEHHSKCSYSKVGCAECATGVASAAPDPLYDPIYGEWSVRYPLDRYLIEVRTDPRAPFAKLILCESETDAQS